MHQPDLKLPPNQLDALKEAFQSGESVTQVAERLSVDISTLAQHKALYGQVRRATRERKASAECARQDAAIASAEAVAVKLVRGNARPTHRNARRAGSTNYASDTAAAVLATIWIGLGDRSVRYPTMAARMGEPFRKKIELPVQRFGALAGVPQKRLPLQYREAGEPSWRRQPFETAVGATQQPLLLSTPEPGSSICWRRCGVRKRSTSASSEAMR
jgi:transposase-like protein